MASKIHNDIFARSKKNKQLIGIREYKKDDDFIVGYVVAFNNHLLAYQCVSQYGTFDGLYIQELKNIESIEVDSVYLKACQFLIDSKAETHNIAFFFKKLRLPNKVNWQTYILEANPDKGKIVSVDVGEDYGVCGIIMDFDEASFSIKPISGLGEDEGLLVFRTPELNFIQFGTPEIFKRQSLYEWNQQKGSTTNNKRIK